MKNSSYSVLFMRDDADVKTLRVSPRRLRLLLWISTALTVIVLIGLIVGLRSFVGYRSLLSERRDLEVQLAEAQVNLERLGNLDKLQKGGASGKDAGKDAGQGRVVEKSAQAASRAFVKVNAGTIAVENFRAQVVGATLTTSFDLNNRAQGSASGDITLLLLRSDGSLTELDAASASDLTYQIQRFKRISATTRVPEGLTRREALGLRVEIKNSDGEVILGETYSLGN
ncbi:MAG: hypothetical protein Q8O35_10250 [Humidesulfovibrio sp.]|jgi:hypothetical protein|uniref:hypothetical protein n=1 Tax=Humidesulfovibrio sp. TaxID=2910988 RepID=UPI00273553A8|nr:hypothetical protein [Humidesulfovibrio sp.]MDP2848558.1 hypothetical protein [Humidesulfovibrio sp.]